MSIALNRTAGQSSAWTAEHDENGSVTHAMGPSLWEPGIDIYTAWDSNAGPQAYDEDGNVIPAGNLLKYAVQLLRLHDALRAAQKEVGA